MNYYVLLVFRRMRIPTPSERVRGERDSYIRTRARDVGRQFREILTAYETLTTNRRGNLTVSCRTTRDVPRVIRTAEATSRS